MVVFAILVLGLFILYLIAKILIPVLTVILKFFALIAALSPFVLFTLIGLLIGLALANREKL